VTGSIKFDLTIDPLLASARALRGNGRRWSAGVDRRQHTKAKTPWCWRRIGSCWPATRMPC
jgi:hypothetical protein